MTGDFTPTTSVDCPVAKKAALMTIFKGSIIGDIFLMARATTLIADSIGSVARATISIADSNSLVAKSLARAT